MVTEIGSEFHWLDIVWEDFFLPWPETRLWLATARSAMVAIWNAYPSLKNRVLYVPEYFCGDVIAYWQNCGIPLRLYPDNPLRPAPNWNGLNPYPGDIVLAVNYFGIRKGEIWKRWRGEHPEVILVEDHSHDLHSQWSLTSNADYAFASIRKTFPIADGALLWSPQQHPLPVVQLTDNWEGSARKLAAMILKREYLLGSEEHNKLKETFRQLQIEGEAQLAATEFASIAPWSKACIEVGFPVSWRAKRRQNVRHFIDRFEPIAGIESLFQDWNDEEQCPFNPILVFQTQALREQTRRALIAAKIYPAIHWELDVQASEEARSLANRILTIPLDQRYSEQHVERCIEQLNLITSL